MMSKLRAFIDQNATAETLIMIRQACTTVFALRYPAAQQACRIEPEPS